MQGSALLRPRCVRAAQQLRASGAPRPASSAGESARASLVDGGASGVSVGEGLVAVAKGLRKGLTAAGAAAGAGTCVGLYSAGTLLGETLGDRVEGGLKGAAGSLGETLGDRVESGMKSGGESVKRGLVQGGALVGAGTAVAALRGVFVAALAAGALRIGRVFADAPPQAQPAGGKAASPPAQAGACAALPPLCSFPRPGR